MQLDAVLIDVAGDFGALRLVFSQLVLQIRDAECVTRGCFEGPIGDDDRLPAFLTGEGKTCGRRINNERRRTMQALEDDVGAPGRQDLGGAACLHRGVSKQEVYRREVENSSPAPEVHAEAVRAKALVKTDTASRSGPAVPDLYYRCVTFS